MPYYGKSPAARTTYRRTADGRPPITEDARQRHSLQALAELLTAQEHRCWGCLELQTQARTLRLVYVKTTGQPFCAMCQSCIRLLHLSPPERWERLAQIRREIEPDCSD